MQNSHLTKNSLRYKLRYGRSSGPKVEARRETQVIVLDQEIYDVANDKVLPDKNAKTEIENWNNQHSLQDLVTAGFEKEYNSLLKILLANLINASRESGFKYKEFKSLLNSQEAKDRFLLIPRKLRLKAIRRLESLFNRKDPLFLLFLDPSVKHAIMGDNIRFIYSGKGSSEQKISIFFSKRRICTDENDS